MARTFILILISLVICQVSLAESKRIEVYSLSQNYWDTRPGETLSEIAQNLLPNNPGMQQSLMQDIVRLNPEAFIDNDPDRLIANKRLWLPNHLTRADSKVNHSDYNVQSFSWGNIKRPRR